MKAHLVKYVTGFNYMTKLNAFTHYYDKQEDLYPKAYIYPQNDY
jgi:hypothetical protein